jgi:ribosomal-protein-alanine N-acetyltransferase
MLKSESITSKRLTLRNFKQSDKQAVTIIFFDEIVKKTYMIPDFHNEKEAEMLFNKLCGNSHSQHHFVYAICLDDTLIGFINDVYIKDGEIELGYVINSHYHRKGYMTEALSMAINELFRIGYKRIIAGYFVENIASKRVMEKCHMIPLEKEEEINYKGEKHLAKYYAIEKGE